MPPRLPRLIGRRSTRWLRDPDRPQFRNALATGRQEMRQAVEAQLLALASKAAECLEGALALGDGKFALALCDLGAQ
jgi:hypothetical protein